MSIFTEVKTYVKPRECLRFYLGPPKKEGTTCFYLSPFRNEKTPSLTANDYKGITDFGTGEHFDIVSFVARFFNLPNYQAAQKLAADFRLSTSEYKTSKTECKEYQIQKGLQLWRDEARNRLRIHIKTLKELIKTWLPDEELFTELVLLKADLETYEDILNCSYDREGWKFVFRQLGGDYILAK